MMESDLRRHWIEWIITAFENRRSVFGSLIYPRKPHLADIPKSARIYTEQVLRRSCKSHSEPLRRIFVMEQTPGEEIMRTRVQSIPLIGMPDLPHMHFVMEVPNGMSPVDFVHLCEDRWYRMNKRDISMTPRLAKVEEVSNLPAVARYITKEYWGTQGQNIILTHATHLKESAVAS
ncbi:MAG: hypothetical protein HP497_11885 [Nitrospira sp.]|nr:hypothetical protein [Nitrospira sp.]